MLVQVYEDRFCLSDCELLKLCTEVGCAGDPEMQFSSWFRDSSSIHMADVPRAAADHPSQPSLLSQSRLFVQASAGNGAAAESGPSRFANGIDLSQDQSPPPPPA